MYCIILLAGCQKGIDHRVPDILGTEGKLPDSVSVSLISALPNELKESSGLCYTDGALWSFGDSGNRNAIYKIDTATGAILQTVTIGNYLDIDWEDITADADYIYIGDVGNNLGFRKDLKILRIKKSDLTSNAAQLSVHADAINYSYTDQRDFSFNTSTNFDCEALTAIGDSLYLFSKDAVDSFTRCYSLTKQPGTYAVSPIATFNIQGRITAAAYNNNTKELALLGYLNNTQASFIWFFDNYTGTNFFAGSLRKFIIGTTTADWQTEALEYVSANRLMMSCETSTSQVASLYYVQTH